MVKNQIKKWRRIKYYLNYFIILASIAFLVSCVSVDEDARTGNVAPSPELIPPPNFTRGLITRRVAEPLYPLRAKNLGIEGWVTVEFSVDEEGEVLCSHEKVRAPDVRVQVRQLISRRCVAVWGQKPYVEESGRQDWQV